MYYVNIKTLCKTKFQNNKLCLVMQSPKEKAQLYRYGEIVVTHFPKNITAVSEKKSYIEEGRPGITQT